MNIEINDLITLDDKNEYVVVSKTSYNGKEYFYIADINDTGNLKFCYLDGDELVEVSDSKTIRKLLSIFKTLINV